MGDMVIVAYRPHPGRDDEVLSLCAEHVPLLRRLGLATARPGVVMRAGDGSVVEVFEWADGGIEAAHHDPDVQSLWGRYAAACDYVTLGDLAESGQMWAQFRPIDP